MATNRKPTKTEDLTAEVDVTPKPNIRLIKDEEPVGEGEVRVGMNSAGLVPSADEQIGGWYTADAGAIRAALPKKFESIRYDPRTDAEIVKDCVNC